MSAPVIEFPRYTKARLRSEWSRRWEIDADFRERTKKYYQARYAKETAKRQRWAYQGLVKKGNIKNPSAAALERHGLVEWYAQWRAESQRTTTSDDSGTMSPQVLAE